MRVFPPVARALILTKGYALHRLILKEAGDFTVDIFAGSGDGSPRVCVCRGAPAFGAGAKVCAGVQYPLLSLVNFMQHGDTHVR